MTKNLLPSVAIVLGLIVLGVASDQLLPMLAPKTDVQLPLSDCNLNRQACSATLPNGSRLEFSIEPRPIPALEPLLLEVKLTDREVRKVAVDFTGTTMQMGYNRPPLQPSQDSRGKQFSGQATLPVCISGSMEWQATVLVETGDSLIAAPFRFVIGKTNG